MSERTCTMENCDSPYAARGWCARHYYRWKKYGDPGHETDPGAALGLPFRSTAVIETCTFDDCPDPARSRGLCWGHKAQYHQTGTLRPKVKQRPRRTCKFPDCGRKHGAFGWCHAHYHQTRADPEAMFPVGDRPRRHRTVTGHGYVKIWGPDHPNAQKSGWVLEHAAVMSKAIGRPLRSDENVHHKNGDRADNRLSNLELWSHWQPKGQRVEDKTAWAIELLRFYQPDALAAE